MSSLWGGLLLLTSLSGMANEVFAPSDIPLLDNRFRIDYGVKEITFIIKRKPGTPSVILVRPDGNGPGVGCPATQRRAARSSPSGAAVSPSGFPLSECVPAWNTCPAAGKG